MKGEDINSKEETKLKENLDMPIKAIPFKHQIQGFNIVCKIFGFDEEVV